MANFTETKISEVWQKAKKIEGQDEYRKDPVGAWIQKDQYGKEGAYGWEIDHILPLAKGGTDDTRNLCAMHWKNNRSKADDFPEFEIAIKSNGNKNEECKEKRIWDIKTL